MPGIFIRRSARANNGFCHLSSCFSRRQPDGSDDQWPRVPSSFPLFSGWPIPDVEIIPACYNRGMILSQQTSASPCFQVSRLPLCPSPWFLRRCHSNGGMGLKVRNWKFQLALTNYLCSNPTQNLPNIPRCNSSRLGPTSCPHRGHIAARDRLQECR